MEKLFEYEAVVKSGERIKGRFFGTKSEFEDMLNKNKLLLLKVNERLEKYDNSKFSQDDFLSFVEELYYLTNSGMAIDQALKVLAKSTRKESYKRVLQNILTEIKNGVQLSIAIKEVLSKEKIPLDPLSISFISSSEEVGSMTEGLYRLFEYLSFQKKIRSDIKQALAYPLFLIAMSIVVAFIIFFLIIPRFSSIFSPEEFQKLPSLSYFILSLGNYLNAYMVEVLLSVGVLFIIIFTLAKRVSIPWLLVFYKIPKLSEVILDLQLTIIYKSLSTMISGGLELDKALKQLQKVNLLPELQDLLKSSLYEIKKGKRLSEVFSYSGTIPSSDIALINVGESSASLDKAFESLAKRHSEAFNENVKKLLSILEPTVIVGLGVFIAIIVVAIMMAVMSMTDIVN